VRREKTVGLVGLCLVFMFPLLCLLQLGDADQSWREVAAHTRPSVVRVEASDLPNTMSAVVVERAPLRIAIAGEVDVATLRTIQDGGTIEWRACYRDPLGEFTLLEATRPFAAASTSPTPVDPAAIGDVASLPGDETAVVAVLVAPTGAAEVPMWVGKLLPDRENGRPYFRSEALRPLRGDGAEAASSPPTLDPMLRGAPFVTRDGVVLALYAGTRDGKAEAVPMALVREAVTILDRHAAR